jgi:hypothetical protein
MTSCLLFFGAATLPCLNSFTKLLQHASYFKRLLQNGDRMTEFFSLILGGTNNKPNLCSQ